MYEIEVIDKDRVPTWMSGVKELNNSKAEYWGETGAIKLIRKFRYITECQKCSKCGTIYNHRKRIAWKDETRT